VNILAPDDLAAIYNVNAFYKAGFDGSGQTIAIAGASAIDPTDIESFRSIFNLPANDPKPLLVPGAQDPGMIPDAMGEADLDLEWSGAIAPKATIVYVYSGDAFEAAFYAIDQAIAPVLSLSFGLCELRITSSDAQALTAEAQKAVAQGITWVASSGDSGAAGCESQGGPFSSAITRMNVNVPASIQFVTAVGGSEFNEGNGSYWSANLGANGGSAQGYIPEGGWTDETFMAQNRYSGFASSGGGASFYFSKPSWQTGRGVPNDGARDVPDLALTASWFHDPYALITGGNFTPTGGTSASAPVFAGILALVNQYLVKTGAVSHPGLGNINPTLYALAQNAPTVFHDITSGSNVVPCVKNSTQDCPNGTMGYMAGPGYDQVTGLGSVDAYNLALDWKKTTTTPQDAHLVITSFTGTSTMKALGGFNFTLVIANQGSTDAPKFESDVLFTTNGDVSTAKSWYIYCTWNNGIAAGKSSTCSGTIDLDSSITPGNYTVLAIADAKNAVPQSDHSGGTASLKLTVTQ
jgi:subtilase family serine protease